MPQPPQLVTSEMQPGDLARFNGEYLERYTPPANGNSDTARGPETIEKEATAGLILKADDEQRLILSVVMVPEMVDLQGHIASAEVIEDMAHSFLIAGADARVQHIEADVHGLFIVESYIARSRFSVDGTAIRKGTWLVAMKVMNDTVWELVQDGTLTGFSVGAFGDLEPA